MSLIRLKGKGPLTDQRKSFSSGKSVTSAVEITDELLATINGYALAPLTADEVFVGKQLLAHNGVDRDRERFPDAMLDDFAASLPGKNALYFHDRGTLLPLGLYFDSKTEQMSVEQFKALTGNDPRLPEGVAQVKALWAWYYAIKTADIESILKNINGGTYRHWSIGFNASDLVAVKNDPNGSVLYWEYASPAEALEGSLVWLGAQQGATSQKSAGEDPEKKTSISKGEEDMKTLKILLGQALGKNFGDDSDETVMVASVTSALKSRDDRIATLTTENEGLKADAELGKKYLDDQAAEYARLKALLGECEETEDGKTKSVNFAKSMGVDFLKTELKSLTARVNEKFPDGGHFR